jgi:hypothetical protein
MAKYILTQEQLEGLKHKLVEGEREGSYMAKQQLFTIATLSYKMWEMMEDGTQLEDWQESKIAQAEQSITSVVKSYLYGEVEDNLKGMETLNYDDLVIGK